MFLANYLRDIVPNSLVFHEAGERSRLINVLANAHLAGFVPYSFPRWAWTRIVARDLAGYDREYYIDSNNQLYGLSPKLKELYPNLKIVHIVRDPRSYVRSHINWSQHRLKSYIANHLTPFWQPSGYFHGNYRFIDWARIDPVERYAWIWNYKNMLIEQSALKKTEYLRIRFEDLFGLNNRIRYFNKILNFIGVAEVERLEDKFHHAANPNKSDAFPSWETWDKEKCLILESVCGALMRRYGYGNENAWKTKISNFKGGEA